MGCCINPEEDKNSTLPEQKELASKSVPGTWGEYIPSDEEDSISALETAPNSNTNLNHKFKNGQHRKLQKENIRKRKEKMEAKKKRNKTSSKIPTQDPDDNDNILTVFCAEEDRQRLEKEEQKRRQNQREKRKKRKLKEEKEKQRQREIEMEQLNQLRLKMKQEEEEQERQHMLYLQEQRKMQEEEEQKLRVIEEERKQKQIKIEKRANLRRHAMKELLDTEKTYVGLLKTLIDVFVDPLFDKPEILENKVQNAQRILFSDIKIIYGVNTAFLEDLTKKFEQSKDDTVDIFIGDDLRSFTPYFKSYQSYLNNYENASVLIQRITNLERNKYSAFNEWYDKQRMEFCDGKMLDFYLILPIQRLPRYKLCLHEIIKNTEKDHPDFDALKKAEKAIVDVTTLCNERMKEYQSRSVVREIEYQFVSYSSVNTQLVTPSRRFIKVCSTPQCLHVSFFSDFCFVYIPKSVMINLYISLHFILFVIQSKARDSMEGDEEGR